MHFATAAIDFDSVMAGAQLNHTPGQEEPELRDRDLQQQSTSQQKEPDDQQTMQTLAQHPRFDPVDAMHMASLQQALPNIQGGVYEPGHGYAMASPPAVYQTHHHPQQAPYHGYPQMSPQPGPMPYPIYMEQTGHAMQHRYAGQQVYGAPHPTAQYGMYPPGYGPPSPVQQRNYAAPTRSFSLEMSPPGATSGAPNGRSRPGGLKAHSRSPPVPAAPRGPPRKPKQSGHALWVGNLPPGTRVNDLKDHFAREATNEIESVFLISKSNCAFVNYRTEEACATAMTRFHDSRFQGVRLVTRLRKTPEPTPSSTTTSPSKVVIASSSAQQPASPTQSQTAVEAIARNRESSQKATKAVQITDVSANDKYFVVKSLTAEDLELSVRNGIWATQGHNEEALNKAFASVDNVYLIFSANKSGEYYGYARMESTIDDETAQTLEWKQNDNTAQVEAIRADPDLPRSIPTAATEWAPRGRIIDDSARGTIFWEAESGSMEEEQQHETSEGPKTGAEAGKQAESGGQNNNEASSPHMVKSISALASPTLTEIEEARHQPFGRPFRVRWVSTNRLPFYRTRGMRNAWNANREVKIARDGTELETEIGRRLVSMFHRPPGQHMHQQNMPPYMNQFQGHVPYGMQPYTGTY